MREPFDVLAGTGTAQKAMLDYLVEHNGDQHRSLEDALKLAAKTWPSHGHGRARRKQRGRGTREARD